MRVLLILITLTMMITFPVMADDRKDVKTIVRERIDVVIQLLKRKDISKPERNQKIIDTVVPIFDFKRMAKLSLGKKHWKSAKRDQRKEFSDLFVTRLQESYLEKLDLYTDEEVIVEEAKKVKKRIYVVTHLVTKDDKKEMIYKFYKTKNGWKVYDVEILGVSIVQTYRSQFSGVLQSNTFEQLLDKLRSSQFTNPD